MKTKKRISGTIIRRTVVAVLFSSAIVTFALAVNLSNRSPLDSAERGYGKHDHAAALAGTSRQSRTLSFAERVAYQRAIEEAYWQHRIWPKENADPKPPLDKVMSHEAIGKKVEDYLRDSKALEDYWQRPITPDQLQAEMERIASHTKQPGVLRELFAALSNDPFVIAECLARPVLAERLITELYAHGQRFHGELKHRAEAELANRSVREMEHTSGTYSEIEWVKSDNDNKVAHASRLRDGSAGEAPALQRENTPNAVKLVSTEWNDHVAKLAAAFESSPRRVGPAADADMSAHSKNAPSTFQLFPGRRSLGEGGNASTALPMGKLSPLQEDDARYYAMAVTNKGKDRLKLATIAWLKEPLRSWLAKAEAHVPMTMAAVSANYTLPVISGQSDNSIPSGGPMADKIAPWVMEHTANGQQAEFFVVLSDQADLSHAATLQKKAEKGRYVHETLLNKSLSTQGPILQWLRERGLRGQSFHIVNAILVKGPRDVAETLAARPDVARIEGNPHVQNHFPQPEAVDEAPLSLQGLQRSATIEPGIRYTHAPQVWDLGFTGQGIVVAGADTGIRWTHNALKPHYRGWNGVVADHDYNWHDSIHDSTGNPCGNDSPFPCDDNAHGTHTVGTMVGDDGGENQIGMAPDAKWIGCRNMNQGEGTPARVIECMQWFLAPTRIDGSDPDPTKAPDITNNSWHCPTSEGCSVDSLQAAVEAQAAAGIMMVSAAQNAGPNCSTVSDPPGIYAATYSVGALTTGTDNIAFFSSRGPVTADGSGRVKPDISAPGTFTRSCTNDSDSSYAFFSGTSMATPHIAGAVALLWSAIPSLRHQLSGSRDALNNSAVPIASTECGDAGPPNNVYGWGRVDILAAVGGGSPTPTPIPMACTGDDTWIPTELTNAPDARDGHTAVWTGSEMIVWGGAICIQNVCPFLNTGSRYNPTTDSWTPTSLANAPDARYHPTAVWTGSEMIVWGGQSADGLHFLNTGGKYNPSTNSWTPISTINAPAGRGNHTAVWTGSEMIVWGGCIDVDCNSSFNTGGRYNPSTDSWTPISTINAPPNRWAHTAVWTGSEMIVWGGTNDSTGGRYNPSTDSWRATSTANAPAARDFHTAVWTGSEMIVWGGNNFNTGGKYDPSTDSWTATSTINAPAGREWHTAVWTGSEMIVWGGTPDYSVPPLYTGGRYNPGTDKWTATSLNNAPTRREFHTAVWTGSQMIVWGGSPGSDGTPDVYSGARYCAAAPGPTPTPSPTPTPTATPTATPTPPPPQVETPVISPNGGTFKKKVMVTISDNMPGATIYYTTDGSDPTTSSPVYGATGKKKKFKGIRLKGAGQFTVKAMATAPGFQNSAVASALFTRTK